MESGGYVLRSGRTVRLVRFYVDETYAGLLEGTPLAAAPHILARVRDHVRRALPPGRPLLIIRPETAALPHRRLVVELESRRGVRTTDPDWASRLFICWFVDDPGSVSIDALVQSVLPSIDWEAQADDFDVTLL
jgi:hypothetical protein